MGLTEPGEGLTEDGDTSVAITGEEEIEGRDKETGEEVVGVVPVEAMAVGVVPVGTATVGAGLVGTATVGAGIVGIVSVGAGLVGTATVVAGLVGAATGALPGASVSTPEGAGVIAVLAEHPQKSFKPF